MTTDPESFTFRAQVLLNSWKRTEGPKVPFEGFDEYGVVHREIGHVDDRPIYAHGFRRAAKVLLEGSSVEVSCWIWSLDPEEAVAESLAQRDCVAPSTPETDLCQELVGKTADGRLVQVYRVASRVSGSDMRWQICLEKDICRLLHTALFARKSRSLPNERVEAFSLQARQVMQIKEVCYATCPLCSKELIAYGTWTDESWKKEIFLTWCREWHLTRATTVLALELFLRVRGVHASVSSWCLDRIEEYQEFRGSDEFRAYQDLIDPERVSAYDEALKHLASGEVQHLDSLERAYQDIRQAFKRTQEEIERLARSAGAFERLHSLLQKFFTTCPICDQPVQMVGTDMEQGSIRELIVSAGYIYQCGCRERMPEGSRLAAALGRLKGSEGLRRLIAGFDGEWIDVVRVTVGDRQVLTCYVNRETALPLLVIDRKALNEAEGPAEAAYVFSQSVHEIEMARADRLERLVKEGKLIKLNLEFDRRRDNWSETRRSGELSTAYVVGKRALGRVENPGWYYCREIGRPKDSKKPDFILVLVDPVAPVLPERQPLPSEDSSSYAVYVSSR